MSPLPDKSGFETGALGEGRAIFYKHAAPLGLKARRRSGQGCPSYGDVVCVGAGMPLLRGCGMCRGGDAPPTGMWYVSGQDARPTGMWYVSGQGCPSYGEVVCVGAGMPLLRGGELFIPFPVLSPVNRSIRFNP